MPRTPRRLALTVERGPAFWIATWFGSGLSPYAPGTVGTLAALPLYFALRRTPEWVHLAALAVFTVVGVWSAHTCATRAKVEDPGWIVIDEVAGVWLALAVVRGNLWGELAAVALFRLFDIWKPGPIRRAEHWGPAGIGIMADDLMAGAVSAAILLAVTRLVGAT